MSRTFWTILACTAIGLNAAACGKKRPAAVQVPPPPAAVATAPSAPPAPAPAPAPRPVAETEEDIFARKTLEQLNAERPLGDVFFELDSDALREADRMLLQRNAAWLKRWASTRIVVEGHCDARGSSEYNLSLGERRASAVRGYLVSLGIPAERVVSLSKGKEQPFCHDQHEGCWQQNRRGHFQITAK